MSDIFGARQEIDFGHRLFATLTHLEIFDDEPFSPEKWAELALIPHLTHLCFNEHLVVDMLLVVLRACASLRVLVVFDPILPTPIASNGDERALAQDPRFVAMTSPPPYQDWTTGAHSGIDYWSRAEDFVAKRRAREIDPLQYTLKDEVTTNVS